MKKNRVGSNPFNQLEEAILGKPEPEESVSLDFVHDDDLEKIEVGIKETQKGIDTANLAIALAIVRIDRESLYAQAGFKSATEYFREADIRLNMPKQTVSVYRKIGQAYLEYKEQLKKNGFEEEGNLYKLIYLDRALENHTQEEVFKNINSISLRKFKDFAYSSNESMRMDSPKNIESFTDYSVSVTKRGVKVDDTYIVEYSDGIDDSLRKDVSKAVKEAFRLHQSNTGTLVLDVETIEEKKEMNRFFKEIFKIRANGDEPLIIGVSNTEEKRAIKRFLEKYRLKSK